MQPLSGPGAPLPADRPAIDAPGGTPRLLAADLPLTPAQRTTLERLIVKIMALSTLKAPELWAGVRHEVGVKNDAGLLARHFPQAEQFLNTRLSQVQDGHATRQLLQQLTDRLPTGNNRQAVSDFIRQQFGHTVLSSLNPDQLRQVLTMLQNGQMAIPQPQQTPPTGRTLLPAEQQTLNQQVTRLAATTGEQPVKLWALVLKVVNLHSGDPIPARVFPLLNQYLHASQTLNQQQQQQQPTTLHQLTTVLKQPPDSGEQRMLEEYSQQRFGTPPQAVLTTAQAQDLLNLLFSRRASALQELPLAASEIRPQPLVGTPPPPLPSAPHGSRTWFTAFAAAIVVVLILWILL